VHFQSSVGNGVPHPLAPMRSLWSHTPQTGFINTKKLLSRAKPLLGKLLNLKNRNITATNK